MRTLGLLGGMSWESTAIYYRRLNELVRDRCGGLHSAELLMRSVDFAPIASLQASDEWDRLTEMVIDAAMRLDAGGA
ncbi:MAG: aspartate racemase, partial [Sphingomonadaceae bacterium]|nr:aspartate racemase [Sphingomonadaceae bacterium]